MRQLKITKSITNRESQSLEKYLQEIGKVELISSEEEVRLAVLIRQGCQKSLDRLTKANLRFVVSVAKQYQNQGLSWDLSKQHNVLTKPVDLSSSRTLFGGSARAFCRHWPNNPVSFVCPSTK